MSESELNEQGAKSTFRPTGLGITQEELRLWGLMGSRISHETFKKRLGGLETIARFYEVDTTEEGWLTEILFKLALEHPYVSERKRKNGRPRSIEKFASDRSFLRFVFKLRAMLSAAQGRRVTFRHVAFKLAVLEMVERTNIDVLEALRSSEAEDRVAYFAKRIAALRKQHPDIEADSRKPTHLPGTDSRASE